MSIFFSLNFFIILTKNHLNNFLEIIPPPPPLKEDFRLKLFEPFLRLVQDKVIISLLSLHALEQPLILNLIQPVQN